jgi:DNA repair protein SbcC/Rad50
MRLHALRIHRLPGIRPGFSLEGLGPGVNLILGPNASGKSSLVRSLRYLLSESERNDPLGLFLEAELFGAEETWTVLREGSRVEWRRDGSRSDPPLLPESRFLHCYWLAVEDLLAVEHEADAEIHARLRRELTGGYDLDALLARSGPFQVAPRHGRTEEAKLRKARGDSEKVAGSYRKLQRERERIPELEEQIRAGTEIASRIVRTGRALELLTARRARLEAEAAVDTLSVAAGEMARLRGDEEDRLGKMDARKRDLTDQKKDLRRTEKETLESLQETGLVEERPSMEDLSLHRKTLQRARDLIRDRRSALEALDQARGRERTAAEDLGADEGEVPRLDPGTVSQVEELAHELEGTRHSVQELMARLEGVPDAPDDQELEAHREGVAALNSWISAGGSAASRMMAPGGLALFGSLVAVGALLVDRQGLAMSAGLIAAAGALAAVLLGWSATGERKGARERFRKTGLGAPEKWTIREVTQRVEEIDARSQELRTLQHEARKGEENRGRLVQAQRRQEKLESRKEELAREVGFDPARTASSLYQFVHLVGEVRNARGEVRGLLERISRLDKEVGERAVSLQAFVVRWGEPPPREAGSRDEPDLRLDALEAALDTLDRRTREAETSETALSGFAEDLEELDEELNRVLTEEEAIYREAGLEHGDRRTLERRLELLPEYTKRSKALQDASTAEETLRRVGLEGEQELLDLVEADDEEGLRASLAALKEQEAALEELKAERTTIVTRVNDAGADGRLEEALAQETEALSKLEAAREEALLAEAGTFLLEKVTEEHRTAHQPEVLRDAKDRFARFTHDRWTLELGADGQFMALDAALGESRTLAQLSSGTRMQLLLALRVAWARFAERGREPLPLFLDEALTTSDPERFSRVAESLASLAEEEGRQVVYLSAQPTDILLWERALGQKPHVIDLAELRFARPSEPGAEAFDLPERTPVPAPSDREDPQVWAARLGVPPVNTWEDPGAIHLFHLLRDDPVRLHQLMDAWAVSVLGQLENLLGGSAREAAVPDSELRQTWEARCRLARIWVDAWQKGRGRPVDRGALEASGAVSDTFLDQVTALAREVGGDAQALVTALPDVPRYRAAKVVELKEWLEENGYLPPGEPLDAAGREALVLREGVGLAEPGDIRDVVRRLEAGLVRIDEG